ncbi:MAG: YfhO family protein [Candidatus Hydrogenedentes bacterium]|nr:YfhO family protein [Candidatus Hydrogenedentota bacterium]
MSAPSSRTAQDPGRPVARSHRAELALCVVVMALATAAVYTWVLAGTDELRFVGTGDATWGCGPSAFLMDYAVQHGEIPFWNPLAFCGMPYAAHPGRPAFYPPYLLRSALTVHPTPLRTHAGLAILIGLHVVLAGLGAFLLARSQGISRAGAFVTAFAFAFGSNFIMRTVLGHWLYVGIAAWFPFLLLAMGKALGAARRRDKIYFAVAGGIALGMAVHCGVPQPLMTMGFALAAYYVVYRLLHRPALRDTARPRPVARVLIDDALAMGLMAGLGFAIGVASFLPALEFAGHSARTGSDVMGSFTRIAEEPPWNVLQLLLTYPGLNNSGGLRFAGAGVVILALAAFTHPNRRAVALHAAMFYIAFDCCMGVPFPFAWILSTVSPFSMNVPARGTIYVCLFLGLLAGFGLDAMTTRLRTARLTAARSGALLVAGLVLLDVLQRCLSPHPYLGERQGLVLFPACVLLAAVGAAWIPWKRAAGGCMAAAVFLELWRWNLVFIPSLYAVWGLWDPGGPEFFARERTFWPGNQRAAGSELNKNLYDLEGSMDGYDPLFIEAVRRVACDPAKQDEYYRGIGAYEATRHNARGYLFLKRPFWLARQYVRGPLPPADALFPAATTVFLPEPPEALAVPEVGRADLPESGISADFEESPVAVPRVGVAEHPKLGTWPRLELRPLDIPPRHSALTMTVALDRPVTVESRFAQPGMDRPDLGREFAVPACPDNPARLRFMLPDYRPIEAVFDFRFEDEPGAVTVSAVSVQTDANDEEERLRILSRGMNAVEVELRDLPEARILTFTDADYPGWRAFLDGHPMPIMRANDVFKAVAVPAGTHRVRFVFRPWRQYAALLVSGAVFVAAVTYLAGAGPRRRRPAAPSALHG